MKNLTFMYDEVKCCKKIWSYSWRKANVCTPTSLRQGIGYDRVKLNNLSQNLSWQKL